MEEAGVAIFVPFKPGATVTMAGDDSYWRPGVMLYDALTANLAADKCQMAGAVRLLSDYPVV